MTSSAAVDPAIRTAESNDHSAAVEKSVGTTMRRQGYMVCLRYALCLRYAHCRLSVRLSVGSVATPTLRLIHRSADPQITNPLIHHRPITDNARSALLPLQRIRRS